MPPDGNFCLMTYHIGCLAYCLCFHHLTLIKPSIFSFYLGCQSSVAIPIYIRHQFCLPKESNQSQTGKIEIMVGPKQTMGRLVSLTPRFFILSLPVSSHTTDWKFLLNVL